MPTTVHDDSKILHTNHNNFKQLFKKSLKSIQHSDRTGRLNQSADRTQADAEIDGQLSVKPQKTD